MAFCKNCGKELIKEEKFCTNCGTSVSTNESNQRKMKYEGEMHKCPSCGEVLNSFVTNCPSCGYEIRGVKANENLRDFSEKLSLTETDSQKISLIRSFPVPNAKEDIFEFMIIASSNINAVHESNVKEELLEAWQAKIEQCYRKAKIMSADNPFFIKIQDIYNQVNHENKKHKMLNIALRTIGLWGGLIVFLIVFFIDVFSNNSVNTSIYHLGGLIVMLIGAYRIGNHNNVLIDAVIGAICAVTSILLGTMLQEMFQGNGSSMELAGGAVLVIVTFRVVVNSRKIK